MSKFIIVLGLWVLLSPWTLGFSGATIAKWNNVIAGVIMFLAGLWSSFGIGSDSKK